MRNFRHPRKYKETDEFSIEVNLQEGEKKIPDKIRERFDKLVNTYEEDSNREWAEKIKHKQRGGEDHASLAVLFGLLHGHSGGNYEEKLSHSSGKRDSTVIPDYVNYKRRLVGEYGGISMYQDHSVKKRIQKISEGLIISGKEVKFNELPHWRFVHVPSKVVKKNDGEYEIAEELYNIYRISSLKIETSEIEPFTSENGDWKSGKGLLR